MPALDIKFEWESLVKRLSKIKARSAFGMHKTMEKALIFLEARIKESVREKLNIQPTGRLRSSWTHDIKFAGTREDMTMEGRVGTNVKYARTHEFGDLNRTPTHAAALTIPWPGTAGKYPPARQLWNQGSTFIVKRTSWGGRGIIFLKQRATKKKVPRRLPGIPIYVLAKSVSIPARPYIKPVLETYNRQIVALLGRGWKADIEKE